MEVRMAGLSAAAMPRPLNSIATPCLSCYTCARPRARARARATPSCRLKSSSAGHRRRMLMGVKSAYISAPPADANPSAEEPGKDGWFSEKKKEEISVSMPIIWSLCSRHKLRLLLSALALFGSTFCTLTMPIYSGRFFEILIGVHTEPLRDILCKIGILYSLEPIFTTIYITNMITVWEKVMTSLRMRVFKRILIQKVEFFDRHKVGELTGIVTSNLGVLRDLVNENISRDRGLRAFSELLGTLVILFLLSAQLAPLLGMLMLSISVFVATLKRTTIPIFKGHGQSSARVSDCVSETFSAIRTVRSFGGELKQMAIFKEQIQAFEKSGIKLGWLKSANESLTRIMIYVSLITLYALGGSKVKLGLLSIGTMASFIGYTFTLTFSVQGVVNTLGDFRATIAAVDRINSIVAGMDVDESLAYGLQKRSQSRVQNQNNYHDSEDDAIYSSMNERGFMSGLKKKISVVELAQEGDVALEDVYFSYPLRSDVQVLNGLNLQLKRGLVTALVGSSGAGKSTIVQLLARFYEPTQGRITIAGEDIRSFDKSEWAQSVSMVNQDPVLFSMSIAENIAYGLPDEKIAQEDIVSAAKAANAHDFIVALPQGYETSVGERGGLLSGGQRQRIAIARAILKNAPILILDEATSALDAVSERAVQEALEHLMKGRTTLVIAHRLSTVQNAYQIAVISEGKVIELGNHSELLSQEGVYSSLVDTQKLAFK